jgi:hypothetical protein
LGNTHPVHYSLRINEWIIDFIVSDRLRITADPIEHNLALMSLVQLGDGFHPRETVSL